MVILTHRPAGVENVPAERPGSKVRFVRDSVRMFAGLWGLRRRLRGVTIAAPVPSRKAA